MLQITHKQHKTPYEIVRNSAHHTPDFVDLDNTMNAEHTIFVVGRMKKYLSENLEYLEGCTYYGKGQTWSDMFIMKKSPYDGEEPLTFQFRNRDLNRNRFFNNWELGSVSGDIYGVSLRTLTRIDDYEMNGFGVHRKKVEVQTMDFRQPAKTILPAFVS